MQSGSAVGVVTAGQETWRSGGFLFQAGVKLSAFSWNRASENQ